MAGVEGGRTVQFQRVVCAGQKDAALLQQQAAQGAGLFTWCVAKGSRRLCVLAYSRNAEAVVSLVRNGSHGRSTLASTGPGTAGAGSGWQQQQQHLRACAAATAAAAAGQRLHTQLVA